MARRGRVRAPRREHASTVRRVGNALFYTSRRAFDDLTVVVKRFPHTADSAGPVFVLVHGIGVSSRYFHPIAAELAKTGAVYLVDLPGYGAAPDPRRDVSIADHARVLARMLRDSSIENPVLVGHSMGSQVVSRLAVDSPDVTERLVLLAPTMPVGERSFWPAAWRLIVGGLSNPPRANAIVMWDYFVRCGMPYFFRQLPHVFGDRIEERLPRIRAKTLVLTGDRDLLVPASWARAVAEAVPEGHFETVRGPHLIMSSDPVRVAARIVEHAR